MSQPLCFLVLASVSICQPVSACLTPAIPAPAPATAPQGRSDDKKSRNETILKALGKWVRVYRQGKWELTGATRPLGKKSLLPGTGLAPETSGRGRRGFGRGRGRGGGFGRGGRGRGGGALVTARDELRTLLKAAARMDTVAAAEAVIAVAAVGLDRKVRYTSEMIPNLIRDHGQQALARMDGAMVREYLLNMATGEGRAPASFKLAYQAAAILALGRTEDAKHVRTIERLMSHHEAIIRVAAAEALAGCGDGPTVKLLAEALQKERVPNVIIAILDAVKKVHAANKDKVDIDHLRHAVVGAGKLLGQTRSWPADLAIIDFLERFRYRDSIPKLIELLEDYANNPDKLKTGRQIRTRANEVLVAITGAHHSAEKPAAWRQFWEQEKGRLKVVERVAAEKSKPGTVGSEFFGIPVKGTRVVFIIDVSGSMAWPMGVGGMRGGTTSGGSRGRGAQIAKIDKAKEQLIKAVNALPAETKFNVILYSDRVERWKSKLVFATDRNKKALARMLDGERANGSTNLYGALKMGLEIKSLVYGDRYDSNVDEIFVLSDGVPTSGEVVDPDDILRHMTATNKFSGVRINTIYLAPPDEQQPWGGGRGGRGRGGRGGRGGGGNGSRLMRELAEKNGGKFVWPGQNGGGSGGR